MLKLCQISAASRSGSLLIEAEDFEIALDWLTRAEKVMPDVFLEMAGRSDSDTMREVWHYAWIKYQAEKKALSHMTLMSHLAVRVPAFQAEKILQVMVQAGHLENVGKNGVNLYIPKAQHVWRG